MELLYLIIGLGAGFFIGFLFVKNKKENTSDDDYNGQIHELDKEKSILQDRIAGFVEKHRIQQEELKNQITITNELKEENITTKVINNSLKEKLQFQQNEIEQLQKKFTVEFENIANRILKQNTSEFSETNQKKLMAKFLSTL